MLPQVKCILLPKKLSYVIFVLELIIYELIDKGTAVDFCSQLFGAEQHPAFDILIDVVHSFDSDKLALECISMYINNVREGFILTDKLKYFLVSFLIDKHPNVVFQKFAHEVDLSQHLIALHSLRHDYRTSLVPHFQADHL